MSRLKVHALRDALIAARPIIEEVLQQEIESYATPEKTFRAGSVKSTCPSLDSYYNPDTIDEVGALREVRRCKRILKTIATALNET